MKVEESDGSFLVEVQRERSVVCEGKFLILSFAYHGVVVVSTPIRPIDLVAKKEV